MNFTKYWVLGLLLIFTVFGAYFEEPETYTYSGRSYTSLAPQASDHLTDPAWQFDLAWSYKEAAMFDEALRHIRRAVELNPEMAFLYAKTADIFSEMGKPDSALYYYEKALTEHYEYIKVWEKIILIEPSYNANLGLLYEEKAEEYEEQSLYNQAEVYLNRYLDEYPDGEYADQCRTALSRIELGKRQTASREELSEKLRSVQQAETRRKEEEEADRKAFRQEKPFLVGLGFYSILLSEDHDFVAKNPDEVLDDTLSMKYYASNLNEFGVSGGYVIGPLFLRGTFHYGATGSGKGYTIYDPMLLDTVYIPIVDSLGDTVGIDTVTNNPPEDNELGEVKSVNTVRFSVAADYNFLYKNPVLLYVGAQGDFGIASIDDSPDNNFESISLFGAGVGGGIMLRFSDFLFDLGYRRNLVGGSAGGTITLLGMYKF